MSRTIAEPERGLALCWNDLMMTVQWPCNSSDLSCVTTQQDCLVRSQEADITYIHSSNSSLRRHLTTASSQTNQTPRQANRIRSMVSPPRTNTCSLQSVLVQTMTSVLSSLSNAIHHLHQPEWLCTTTDKAKAQYVKCNNTSPYKDSLRHTSWQRCQSWPRLNDAQLWIWTNSKFVPKLSRNSIGPRWVGLVYPRS